MRKILSNAKTSRRGQLYIFIKAKNLNIFEVFKSKITFPTFLFMMIVANGRTSSIIVEEKKNVILFLFYVIIFHLWARIPKSG